MFTRLFAGSAVVAIALMATLLSGGTAQAQEACHLRTAQTGAPPVGFGVPYAPYSSAQELLLRVECDRAAGEATFSVGTGATTQYIYEQGYVHEDGAWKEMHFGGANKAGAWWIGNADITIDHAGATLDAAQHVVAYVCTHTGGSWKCGCRDEACAQPYWQLQSYRFPAAGEEDRGEYEIWTNAQRYEAGDPLDVLLSGPMAEISTQNGFGCIVTFEHRRNGQWVSQQISSPLSGGGAACISGSLEPDEPTTIWELNVDDTGTQPTGQYRVRYDTPAGVVYAEFTIESTTADAGDEQPQHHTFDLTGVNYEFSQEELRVNEGDTVTVNFTSTDGTHDWSIDAFNAATDIVDTGGSSSVTFVADEAGEFEYYCSVGNHRQFGMVGTLIVEG